MKKNIQIKSGSAVLNIPSPDQWSVRTEVSKESSCLEILTISLDCKSYSCCPEFSLEFPVAQHSAVCCWHPKAFLNKNILPEWLSSFSSELADGAPAYSLIDASGQNILAVGISDPLRKICYEIGFCEFTFEITNTIRFFTDKDAPTSHYEISVRLDFSSGSYERILEETFSWIETTSRCQPAYVPAEARLPWYSTWYGFHKNFTAAEIEEECLIARSLGITGVIVDDGWQSSDLSQGYSSCGDWIPAAGRIPDMAEHVRRIHAMGMKYMLWYSVPFIGYHSRNHKRFTGKYLYDLPGLQTSVLDPRFPEVRNFLQDLFLKDLNDWDLDGFKLDFIDRFPLPPGQTDPALTDAYAGRDIPSIPLAVDHLLTSITTALQKRKTDILIEFRQKYMGPAVRKYGNLIRVTDCPGDIVKNRVLSTDLHFSSGQTAVHGDMLRWHDHESPEAAARQILAVLFSVPQISVRLTNLSTGHLAMIRHRLNFFQEHQETLLQGQISAQHPECNYPVIRSRGKRETITACYCENQLLQCDSLAENMTEIIINASASQNIFISIPVSCQIKTCNCQGNAVSSRRYPEGLHRISIPLSGEAFLTPHF